MLHVIRHLILTFMILSILIVNCDSSAETQEPFELENGLTVFLRPIPTAKSVAFVVLFNIGEDHDPVGKSGMAHLLEHIYVTAAAGDSSMQDVRQYVKKYPLGWNAQTGKDFTVIASVVKSDQFSTELMDVASRMDDLRITQADLQREVPRVIHELNNMYGGIPMLAGFNHARSRLHPIPEGGQRGGSIEHVQSITLDELQQFWKDYYKPNNAVLIIAGKFDKDEAMKPIQEVFSHVNAGKKVPRPHAKLKPDTSIVHRFNVRPVVPNATGTAAIGYAAPLPGSKEYAPFLILHARLASKLQSRFQMGKLQPIIYLPLDDTSTIVLQTELRVDDDIETVLKGLDDNLQEALTTELTSKDKQQTHNYLGRLLNTVEIPDGFWIQNLYGLAFSIGRRHQLKINGKTLRNEIEAITDTDLQKMAETIFSQEKRTTVIIEVNE